MKEKGSKGSKPNSSLPTIFHFFHFVFPTHSRLQLSSHPHPTRRRLRSRAPSAAVLRGRRPSPLMASLFKVVSGAGRILSSVFGSSDSTDDELDEQDAEMLSSDEKEDDISHMNLEKLNQKRGAGEVVEAKTILPLISESKITIAQLIMKETFSREESEKLVKLIQSRVVEASSPVQAPVSPVQASPEMCSAAIAEAKKWLEEKKRSASLSSQTIGLGLCAFNTDMFQSGLESDVGSPADLAKSYMQSKPPWQSPFMTSSSTLFSTPHASGSRKLTDDLTHGYTHSLSSSRYPKRDFFSSGLWDPKEESFRRVRSRPSGSAFDSISSFTHPGSSSRLFDRDILESDKNFSLIEGTEPSNADGNIPPSQAGTAEGIVNTLTLTLGNDVLESPQVAEKEHSTHENADISENVNKETGDIAEVVVLETSNTCEKNDAIGNDKKIVTDEQATLDGNKGAPEPEILSDPKLIEGDLHITISLHGSSNKNSANGMESEFESSINGGTTSSNAGPGASDEKSLNGTDLRSGTETLEPNTTPIRKGRKRVISGRSRSRASGRRGRGT